MWTVVDGEYGIYLASPRGRLVATFLEADRGHAERIVYLLNRDDEGAVSGLGEPTGADLNVDWNAGETW